MAFPRRGEIFWVDFSPAQGAEQAGKRPAVVVSNDILNQFGAVVTVVPITSTIHTKDYPHEVRLPKAGLLGEATVLCNQLRTIAKERLGGTIGHLTPDELRAVERSIDVALGMPKR